LEGEGYKNFYRVIFWLSDMLKHLKNQGRTVSYLARHGMAAGSDVIEKIKELRKDTEIFFDPSPETRKQINMVINWKKDL
jgi:hypothetical protein